MGDIGLAIVLAVIIGGCYFHKKLDYEQSELRLQLNNNKIINVIPSEVK